MRKELISANPTIQCQRVSKNKLFITPPDLNTVIVFIVIERMSFYHSLSIKLFSIRVPNLKIENLFSAYKAN